MTIYTDGPRFGPEITLEEVQAANAVHDRKVMLDTAMVAALIVVLICLAIAAPRVWRRVRVHLSGPVRMPDP